MNTRALVLFLVLTVLLVFGSGQLKQTVVQAAGPQSLLVSVLEVPYLLAPAFAALAAATYEGGAYAAVGVLRRFATVHRGVIFWCLIALLIPIIFFVPAAYLAEPLIGKGPGIIDRTIASAQASGHPALDPGTYIRGLLWVIGQQIGWFGYVLPRLQTRLSFSDASPLLGLLWGAHLLLFTPSGIHHAAWPVLDDETLLGLQVLCHLMDYVMLGILLSALFNRAGGSLWPPTIYHLAAYVYFDFWYRLFMNEALLLPTGPAVMMQWLIALFFAGWLKPRRRVRSGKKRG